VVECLPSKLEGLSSNPRAAKKKKKSYVFILHTQFSATNE
jgi:hypothetical protein